MVKRIVIIILALLALGILVAHLAAKPAHDHPFFDQFGEFLAALSVSKTFFVFDGSPFAMAGHILNLFHV